jgi:hypothetical protein
LCPALPCPALPQVGGQPRIIRPHPDFRLMLALDPRHGEVSRAMRNRGIEIYVLPDQQQQQQQEAAGADTSPVQDAASIPQQEQQQLLASEGVPGRRLLAAMVAAHQQLAAAASSQHRRPPGPRELRSWAALARALLERGRAPPQALWAGWSQVYVRGQAGGPELAAAAQAAFRQLCRRLGMQPLAAALETDDVSAMEVDDDDDEQEEKEGALVAVAAGGSGDSLALVAAGEAGWWPAELLWPAQWPAGLRSRQLAEGSLATGVLRDGALLQALLLQLVATQVAGGSGTGSIVVPGGSSQYLAALPTGRLARLLHAAGSSSQEQQEQQAAVQQEQQQWLHLLVLAAAAAYAMRSAAADQSMRSGWAGAIAQHVQQAAAALGAGELPGSTAQLAAAVISQLLAHPLVASAQQALQPVDARYQLQLAAQQEGQQAQQREQLALVVPLLQAAVTHACVEATARGASEAAVHSGAASAYQLSCYRWAACVGCACVGCLLGCLCAACELPVSCLCVLPVCPACVCCL